MLSRRAYLGSLVAGGFVGLAGCSDASSVSENWPRAGYDDGNSGDVTHWDGPGATLAESWRTEIPDGGYHSTPAVADGNLYLGYGSGRGVGPPAEVGIRVLDAATGERIRDIPVSTYRGDRSSETLYRDSIVASDGAVYVLSFDGVYSYEPDGEERWHCGINGSPNRTIQSAGHPVVVDGVVYAPTASVTEETDATEGLLAIDDETGDVRWRYDVPSDAEHGWTFSAAFADQLVYVSMLDRGVVALDATTGDVEWQRSVPADGPPTVANGRLFVSVNLGSDSALVGLDAATGDELWFRDGSGEWLNRGIAAASGNIYCRERLHTVVCRDERSGEERWRYTDAESVSLGRPVVTDDALYVGADLGGDRDAGVLSLDPETGTQIGFVGLSTNAGIRGRLAASTERLFLNASNGLVYGLDSCSVDVDGHCLY
jgi:outer membrane protein assembly factor BamB